MSLTKEQYQERVREAIAILTVPTEEDAKLRLQLAACNKWLETPDGREMMFKILPYFGSIMKYIKEVAPDAAIGFEAPTKEQPQPQPVVEEVTTEVETSQEETSE